MGNGDKLKWFCQERLSLELMCQCHICDIHMKHAKCWGRKKLLIYDLMVIGKRSSTVGNDRWARSVSEVEPWRPSCRSRSHLWLTMTAVLWIQSIRLALARSGFWPNHWHRLCVWGWNGFLTAAAILVVRFQVTSQTFPLPIQSGVVPLWWVHHKRLSPHSGGSLLCCVQTICSRLGWRGCDVGSNRFCHLLARGDKPSLFGHHFSSK